MINNTSNNVIDVMDLFAPLFSIENINKLQYLNQKEWFKRHSINDSFPELFDKIYDDSLICLFDLEDDNRVAAEIIFDDDKNIYSFEDIYRVIDYPTKYGNLVDLELVTDKKEIMDIKNMVIKASLML